MPASTIEEQYGDQRRAAEFLANGETFLFATESNQVFVSNTAGGARRRDQFPGPRSMTLAGTQIAGNHCQPTGGGIYVNADRPTDITLGTQFSIAGNRCQSGWRRNHARPAAAKLSALSTTAPTQIFLNKVLNDGGSGGWRFGIRSGRDAFQRLDQLQHGGHTAAALPPSPLRLTYGTQYVALTPANPASPVRVSGNGARHTGGGDLPSRPIPPSPQMATFSSTQPYARPASSSTTTVRQKARAIYADSGDRRNPRVTVGAAPQRSISDGSVSGHLGCPQPVQCAARHRLQ
jgi:hypothetical protein